MALMLRAMLLLAFLPGLAQAAGPAEPPPADFAGRQYIDSRGCVFRRGDGESGGGGTWAPRLARDGTAVCGYPPTLSARGLDGRPRLRALDPDAGRSRAELVERALAQTVVTNLRPGELTGDPQAMEHLPDLGPEPASSAPAEALKAAVAAAPAVRQGMGAGLKPNMRLCALLGYDGQGGAPKPGGDPTQGYCGSLPESDLSRLAFARPLGSEPPDAAPASGAPAGGEPATPRPLARPVPVAAKDAAEPALPPARVRPAVAPAVQPLSRPTGPQVAKAPGAAAKAAPARQPEGLDLIPAGARYVQLGAFKDAAAAEDAARKLAGLGYPVLRGREKGRAGPLLMAGPFDGREAIVRALDAIRRAGFRHAVPR